MWMNKKIIFFVSGSCGDGYKATLPMDWLKRCELVLQVSIRVLEFACVIKRFSGLPIPGVFDGGTGDCVKLE